MSDMTISALAPWYGCNRVGAAAVGAQLGKLDWCGVPFMGGAPELPHIKTRGGIANDKHLLIINLAKVVASFDLYESLADRLDEMFFHPSELEAAQAKCADAFFADANAGAGLFGDTKNPCEKPDVDLAAAYFVACWMGRGGHAGKDTELSQGLSVRWTATGGDSVKRFRSAVKSLPAWAKALRVWSFERMDAIDFLKRVRDVDGHGVYLDPPWPEAGKEYRHKDSDALTVAIAEQCSRFKNARVVIRYGDHPMIRDLYPETKWTWVRSTTTSQQGTDVSETLILNGPRY